MTNVVDLNVPRRRPTPETMFADFRDLVDLIQSLEQRASNLHDSYLLDQQCPVAGVIGRGGTNGVKVLLRAAVREAMDAADHLLEEALKNPPKQTTS